MSINRVMISGNLTRDPVKRATRAGETVLTFSVAVNDRRQNAQTGNWEDVPNFMDCVMFGNRADGIKDYLHKGKKVAIEGKLRWSQWQDKETGRNRSKIEVIVDQVEFMSSGNANERGQQPQAQPEIPTAQPIPAAPVEVYDEDIPF